MDKMKTIGRNQKKKAYEIFNNAKNIRAYNLDNGFTGKLCDKLNCKGENWLIRDWEGFNSSKLKQTNTNKYVLRFHSNNWIEFET